MINIPPVRKTVFIQTTADKAFEVFTMGINRWWPKFAGLGGTPIFKSVIEPVLGGRWYEKHEDGSEQVRGHIRAWQPPERLTVTWEINAAFKPDPREDLASDLEVRFVADTPGRTRVELEHRNFERMGAEAGQSMRDRVDTGWSKMLDFFATEASGGTGGYPSESTQ